VGVQSQPLITGTHLKLHPVCFHGQTAVDAAMALHPRVDIAQITDVHIETHEAAYQVMASDRGRWTPTTRETADHSLPFTVAVTLQDGRLLPEAYQDTRLANPSTRALMEKIRVSVSPEMTQHFPVRTPARVSVTLDDGRVHTEQLDYPRGHAANAVSDAELEEKVLALYGSWGGADGAHAVLEVLWSLERCDSAAKVVDALCPLA
jgi:2-methylcitrate dehydratase